MSLRYHDLLEKFITFHVLVLFSQIRSKDIGDDSLLWYSQAALSP